MVLNHSAIGHPAIIRRNAPKTCPLLLNATGLHSSKLVGVKQNFTPTGGKAHRKMALRLSVRLSCGKRSITGQIVVALQRRLAVASPSAQSAQENKCN